jgi:hypothetical protein
VEEFVNLVCFCEFVDVDLDGIIFPFPRSFDFLFCDAETATFFHREWSEKPAFLIEQEPLILSVTYFLWKSPIDRAKKGSLPWIE